jgi:hypothetical protein
MTHNDKTPTLLMTGIFFAQVVTKTFANTTLPLGAGADRGDITKGAARARQSTMHEDAF